MAQEDNGGKPPMYNPATSGITGFLIDLDGTMYRPGSLIEGAKEFYEWLRDSGKQFVFLSNTGSKGSGGTRTKFMTPPYVIDKTPLNLRHIWTASEAQMNFMTHKGSETPNTRFADVDLGIPEGAQVFVLHGGTGEWLNALRMKSSLLFDSWDVRTSLTDEEAMAWAQDAKSSQDEGSPRVFVVMFLDGTLDSAEKHKTNFGSAASKGYEPDWSFALLRKVSAILYNGGQLIYTADDAFNPSIDPRYPGMTFPLPGPGMFADMLKYLMHPCAEGQAVCAGKGGTHGDVFMMSHAIDMLKSQGHNGDLSTIMMIGDRFDTDIRGGCSVGIKTCLVESGAHVGTLQKHFPKDQATYCVPTVGYLVNRPDGKATVLRRPVVSFMGPLRRSSYAGVGDLKAGVSGVMMRESTSHFAALPAGAADFGIETTCISKLSNGLPLQHQIKGAVNRLNASLGGAKPNLILVYSGASKAQTERVVDQISHAFGTNVHCVSTFNGCLSDKGLTDEIGLWAIRDGAGQFATGVATAASAENATPTLMASDAAAQAAQRWGSQGKPPQACFLSCSCGSEEQVIAELGVAFKAKGWENVPVLGGSAAPADGQVPFANAKPFVGSASGFDSVVAECAVAVTLLRVNSVRHAIVSDSLFPETISEPAAITKLGANARVIAEINGVSAKEWYLTQVGADSPESRKKMIADPFLTTLKPLSVVDASGKSRNIQIACFNDDGSLQTYANVDHHSKIVVKKATVGYLADPARAMGPALQGFTKTHKIVGALAITCMGCTKAMMMAERDVNEGEAEQQEEGSMSILSHFRSSLHEALGCTNFVSGATHCEQICSGGSNQNANLMYSLMLFGEAKE